MSNIIINNKKHTIEINKTFAKAASLFGSDEYNALQAARHDNPSFKVVTVSKKTTKTEFKGLTYEYMEKYIAAHDDEEKSIMAEYEMLRGKSDAAQDAMAEAADYDMIKEWFLMTFPAISKFHSDREALLKKIAEQKKARLEAKKVA